MSSNVILAGQQQTSNSWITTARNAPYFIDADGSPWTPIGQNDAITWPDLVGLFRRRDLFSVERYFALLARSGVTCLRLMLEYSQTRHRYFERNPGTMNPHLVRLWDDLIHLCRMHGLRVLLTPFDTYWTWVKWKHHPYNAANGGPCRKRSELLLCRETRQAIKRRLDFVTERWGGDGTIFAWDIWNEIHPAQAGNDADALPEFIEDVSTHLRKTEERLHGMAHLQTVSVFTPVFAQYSRMADVIYRHPCLDFANIHLYEHGTIDDPKNTVDPAVSTGNLIRAALGEIRDSRPFFDSEHGPIHRFKDKKRTLAAHFDDEYFRHIQWAHLASGGCGGGMRWPNRHPHSLTEGMRKAQRAMADFLPLLNWSSFQRLNRSKEVKLSRAKIHAFACTDSSQGLLYLLRSDTLNEAGTLPRDADPVRTEAALPGFLPGAYRITAWDTLTGAVVDRFEVAQFTQDPLTFSTPPFAADIALAITRR